MAKTKTNSAGVDVATGKIMEHGFFPKKALDKLKATNNATTVSNAKPRQTKKPQSKKK